MLPFELLHKDVDSLEVSNLDKEFIKSRLRDSTFSSYKDTGNSWELAQTRIWCIEKSSKKQGHYSTKSG